MSQGPADDLLPAHLLFLLREKGRICPAEMEKDACLTLGVSRRQVKAAVKALTASGEIGYSFEHGRTCLEIGFLRPVRLGRRVFVMPPEAQFNPGSGEVAVRLAPGPAFGCGRHPSTRAAVACMEAVFDRFCPARVADLGAGTGVLGLSALALGAKEALLADTDSWACFASRQNALINNMAEKVCILQKPAHCVEGLFDMVAANLRLPTLLELLGNFARLVRPAGALVVSGIKEDEDKVFLQKALSGGFCSITQHRDGLWRALAFERTSGLSPIKENS
jgi:ribosomal protein L11 methyltransferase